MWWPPAQLVSLLIAKKNCHKHCKYKEPYKCLSDKLVEPNKHLSDKLVSILGLRLFAVIKQGNSL